MSQPPPAQCNSSSEFDWARNSLDQDCCKVGTYLGGQCISSGVFEIPTINSTQAYAWPTAAQSDSSCLCSSVYYQLLQCCAFCQTNTTASVVSWSVYKQNCHKVYLGVFQPSIPSGTKVFGWAYDNITASDGFNVTTVKSETSLPESTAVAPTTSPTSSDNSGHKANAGAIAGGVIGGVVFIVLLLGLVLFFLRRRRRRLPAEYSGPPTLIGPSPVYQTPKLYDPADPSTFPSASPMTSSELTSVEQQSLSQVQYLQPNRNFSGAAEI